jgi:hypothetical protein
MDIIKINSSDIKNGFSIIDNKMYIILGHYMDDRGKDIEIPYCIDEVFIDVSVYSSFIKNNKPILKIPFGCQIHFTMFYYSHRDGDKEVFKICNIEKGLTEDEFKKLIKIFCKINEVKNDNQFMERLITQY